MDAHGTTIYRGFLVERPLPISIPASPTQNTTRAIAYFDNLHEVTTHGRMCYRFVPQKSVLVRSPCRTGCGARTSAFTVGRRASLLGRESTTKGAAPIGLHTPGNTIRLPSSIPLAYA